MPTNTTIMCLVTFLLVGCDRLPTSLQLEPVPTVPIEEMFYGLPRGFPIDVGNAVRDEVNRDVETLPPGTHLTFFLADNQELLASFVIPEGSQAYRRKLAQRDLKKVFERLDPEMSGGSQVVDLISLPATVRKYRKTDLKPMVVIIGSPLIEDRERGVSITNDSIPCDGCVTDKASSYGRMAVFPKGSEVRWLTPRANYGNGPNHRGQIEHFLRYLFKCKKGPLVRFSSDAAVVFNATGSQWDDEVSAQDDCKGAKKVADDEAKPVMFDSDGKTEIIKLQSGTVIKVRKPELSILRSSATKILFYPDTSGSTVIDADGKDQSHIFKAIKKDLCEKLDKMPCTHFAICGFGGWQNMTPRLSKYPTSLLSGLQWAEATRENRDAAIAFVEKLQAGGATPTLAALQEAVNLEGPMTCILYSDGIPTLGDDGQNGVLAFAKVLAKKNVTVHTVGVGALSARDKNFDWSGGDFLARLAQITSGEYFALE